MQRKCALAILLVSVFINSLEGQKPPIANDSYVSWTQLKTIKPNASSIVSNDGKYVIYLQGSEKEGENLMVCPLKSMQKSVFPVPVGSSTPIITNDSKNLIFRSFGDSIGIHVLGTDTVQYIERVKTFQCASDGNGRWLAYNTSDAELFVLMDLWKKRRCYFNNIKQFIFKSDKIVICITAADSLALIDTRSQRLVSIAHCNNIDNCIFSSDNLNLVFYGSLNGKVGVWHYNLGNGRLQMMVSESYQQNKGYSVLPSGLSFSPDGRLIYFFLQKNNRAVIPSSNKIWSYTDEYLPWNTLPKKSESVLTAVEIETRKVQLLTDESIIPVDYKRNKNILGLTLDYSGESYWNNRPVQLFSISARDGCRNLVHEFINDSIGPFFWLAPNERFVVWFDNFSKEYFSYDISSGRKLNISDKIPYALFDDESEIVARRSQFGICGWSSDSTLLIYDRYDFWKLDVSGKENPVNLTKGYGRKNGIILRRIVEGGHENEYMLGDTLLLSAWEVHTKRNGFATINISKSCRLRIGSLGPFVYFSSNTSPNILLKPSEDLPQKAKSTNVYVVRRMSASTSPNLFTTTDFISFTEVSNIRPEKKFNWLKSELITWPQKDGKVSQGILYKPENFNQVERYPVIVHFYEKLSDGLNMFPGNNCDALTAGIKLSDCNINIAWYVSNGYLVFVPDIYYRAEDLAGSIVSSVTSAIKRLSNFSFVDSKKIGVQGHSFGGEETILLISQTNLFAAAQESSGPFNIISYYNHVFGWGNRNHYFDRSQGNMLLAPWDSPKKYSRNSPNFFVDNISTPLLIMHNQRDNNVPFSQGVELFLSLKKSAKPVWLLNYYDEGHQIDNEKSQLSFLTHQQEFFNHYLKGYPIPVWMQN